MSFCLPPPEYSNDPEYQRHVIPNKRQPRKRARSPRRVDSDDDPIRPPKKKLRSSVSSKKFKQTSV